MMKAVQCIAQTFGYATVWPRTEKAGLVFAQLSGQIALNGKQVNATGLSVGFGEDSAMTPNTPVVALN